VGHDSPLYAGGQKTGILYAQSWALVHMLMLSPDYRAQIGKFVDLILNGVPGAEAVERVYRKHAGKVQNDLEAYIRGPSFYSVRMKDIPPLADNQIQEERLSEVEASVRLAQLLIDRRKFGEAEALLRRFEEGHGDNAGLRAALGSLALAGKDSAAALEHLGKAVATGQATARTHYEYGALLLEDRSRLREAASVLRKALEMEPGHVEALYYLGFIEFQLREFESSAKVLYQAVKLSPRRIHLWQSLAYSLFYSGDTEAAKAAAEKCKAVARNESEHSLADATFRFVTQERGRELVARRAPELEIQRQVPTGPHEERGEEGGEPADGPNGAPGLERRPRMAGDSTVEVPETWQNRKWDTQIEGHLIQVDCSGTRARFHIRAGQSVLRLWVEDPDKVLITAGAGATVEFSCGAQRPIPVKISYLKVEDAKRNISGEVAEIEFLAPGSIPN
jgi:tetratricopeptide (TPR) repeat protein